MAKSATNLSIDADIKQQCIDLFSDLGMDLSTAVNIFLRQSLREQGFPFVITRDNPNEESIAAMNEYSLAKKHPEKYKRYSSFKEVMDEVLADA